MEIALVLLGAYLCGAVPWSLLVGLAFYSKDPRFYGSGNLGATNVLRTLGARAAVPVLLLDVGKGALAAAWLPTLLGPEPTPSWLPAAAGATAVMGHVWSVFVAFRGGKGVAAAAGVLGALLPLPLACALTTFLLVAWRSGYVSLGSLSAATMLPAAALLLPRGSWAAGGALEATVLACLLTVFVYWTHRANISRLRRGTESRYPWRKP